MFCTPSERIEIGRRVFAHELTNKEAAAEYGVAEQYSCNPNKQRNKVVFPQPEKPTMTFIGAVKSALNESTATIWR